MPPPQKKKDTNILNKTKQKLLNTTTKKPLPIQNLSQIKYFIRN